MSHNTRRRPANIAAVALLLLALGLLAPSLAPAEGACPNEALRTGASAHLPDCRAYELVSPAYSEGFSVEIAGFSKEGSVLAKSFGSFSEVENPSSFGQQYELVRDEVAGWTATPLDSPFSAYASYNTLGLSPDFQTTLVGAGTRAQLFEKELYLHRADGSLAPVGPLESPTEGPMGPRLAGASEDLRRSLLVIHTPSVGAEEKSSLWPGDKTAAGDLNTLYEYDYTGGEAKEPTLVGISNVGDPKSIGEGDLISDCGTYPGSFPSGDVYNAVSSSGGVVFFTSAALDASCKAGGGTVGPAVNEVYARFRGVSGSPAHTVAISEPGSTDCASCQTFQGEPAKRSPAVFDGASEHGSKVFFTTEQRLLPAAVGSGPFLYEYDFNAPEGARVTLLSTGDPVGARVLGVARVSEDGSHVYFVAEGRLTGANHEDKAPVASEPNLYVSSIVCPGGETACGDPVKETRFIATLSRSDEADWSVHDVRPVQATPDGQFLVFQSTADHLTPDQEGFGSEAGQVFEYIAKTGSLIRVSRGQNGFNNDGNSSKYTAELVAQTYGELEYPVGSARVSYLAMSNDGSRVFFLTKDALTPQALTGVPNVYEFHGGQVGLISDGHDTVSTINHPAVELFGTDESGRDVFFKSADRLVPQDTNDEVVLYDAREDGGFAVPAGAAACSGDTCQVPAAAAPSLLAPGTTAVTGEAASPGAASPGASPVSPKSSSASKRLTAALRACRRQHGRHMRVACEKQARRRYGLHRAAIGIGSHKRG